MKSRVYWTLLAGTALLAYCWIAVQAYRSAMHPESGTVSCWLIGPSAEASAEAANDLIVEGVKILNDTSLPAAERVAGYRENLEASDQLLVKSLRVQPTRALALAQLAALRWELNPPLDAEDSEEYLEMIAMASEISSSSPKVQMMLGELLLNMGRYEEAAPYLARTVELDPGKSAEVIELMWTNRFEAKDILAALPRNASVLTGLQDAFFEEGEELAYATILEETFSGPPGELSREMLTAYGNVCLRLQDPERLLQSMEDLQSLIDDELEAARLHQVSRAYFALGDLQGAMAAARSARQKQPEAIYLALHFGDIALSSGAIEQAIEAYRNTLGLLAVSSRNPATRAGLYSKIGLAEERRGEMAKAYDAYRMAIKLNPGEPHAKKRLLEMEEAAGFGVP